jgi:hypothetical protein
MFAIVEPLSKFEYMNMDGFLPVATADYADRFEHLD